jgi:hypothetical protein
VGAQQGLNDAERVRALEQTIRTKGSMIPGTNGAYICTVEKDLTVINVISYEPGGVVEEKILTLWQGPSKVGPVLPFHNLYLRTEAVLLRNGSVSIIPTYAVIPQGQEEPLSEGVPLPTVVFPYISSHANKTPPALLVGMEEAVSKACKPKSEEPYYPVIVQLLAPRTYHM